MGTCVPAVFEERPVQRIGVQDVVRVVPAAAGIIADDVVADAVQIASHVRARRCGIARDDGVQNIHRAVAALHGDAAARSIG